MNYAKINKRDIANGPGVRVTLFVSGCTHHCPGCFNEEAWDFDYGFPFTPKTVSEIIDLMAPSFIRGITLLGGEPMEPDNQAELLPLILTVKEAYPQKDIWCYTGYTLEQLQREEHPHTPFTDQLLAMIDVLVDGRFELDKKNIRLRFRGSENQRLIDMNATRETGKVALWDE